MNATDLPRERRLPAARVRADLAMLEATTTGAARPTRKRLAIGVGVSVAGLVTIAAAATTVQWGPAPDTSMVRCHTTVQPGRGDSFAGTAVAAADADGVVTITSAVRACSACGSRVSSSPDSAPSTPRLEPRSPSRP